MRIIIKKSLKTKRKIKKENINVEKFDVEIKNHINKIKNNIRKNQFISSFQFDNDYFIAIIAKKINENKIKVKVSGIVKDYGETCDIEIMI